jgi:hypothetical protein
MAAYNRNGYANNECNLLYTMHFRIDNFREQFILMCLCKLELTDFVAESIQTNDTLHWMVEQQPQTFIRTMQRP